jgi:hypothetical protein
MQFEITKMELQPNKFGKNDLLIKQVKVMDDDGKYIKFAKLNDALIDAIKAAEIISVKNDLDKVFL